MFNNFKEEARKIIILAKEEMKALKHPYVSSEHLLLAILKTPNDVSKKLKKYDLTYNKFRDEIIRIIGIGKKESEWLLYTPMFKKILENSISISAKAHEDVGIEHLFQALIDEGEGIAIRILISMNIDLDSLYNEFVTKDIKRTKKKKTILEDIGIDLTNISVVNEVDPVVGRESEIKRIIEILTRRNKNNPLLLGDAGVGKTAIVEELGRLISAGEVPQKLLNKHIISLDMSSLVAGTKYRGEFEEKINKILKEVEDDEDIILFIDEIHTLVGAGGAEGAIDASNIFKPALARNRIKVIGATTITEYKKFLETDKALDRRFQTVIIEEPKKEVVKEIISTLKPIYEDYHKVTIPDILIDKIIEYTDKYIKIRKEPDRTIDILDEVCSHANLRDNHELQVFNGLNKELFNVIKLKKEAILNDDFDLASGYKIKESSLMTEINNLEIELGKQKRTLVSIKDLEEVLESKVKVPKSKFNLNIDSKGIINKLKKKIVGQDKALEKLVLNYKNNLIYNNCYGILLTGPTGVGKTMTATAFASLLEYNIIRLDMSEYSEAHTISKLIGSPPGYVGYNEPAILQSINHHPFTILILDEIERCHFSILNLFFSALDNNLIKDSCGENIYFNNTIIIMTSNVYNSNKVGFNSLVNNKDLTEYFGKSFINRINKIINFEPLTKDDIIKIVKKELKNKANLKIPTNKLENIILKSDYKNYGARQIPYIIKEYEQSGTFV